MGLKLDRKNNLPGLTVPWALYTGPGAGNAGIDASFSYAQGQGNQATFTIQVYNDDVETAIRDCLGTNLYNKEAGRLDRKLPIRHPIFDWMYCDRVTSVRPQGFDGRSTENTGDYGSWDHYMLGLVFTQPRWTMLSDSDIDRDFGSPRQEYRRFLEYRPEPTAEFITREGGAFYWM